jgi:intracellular septation protein
VANGFFTAERALVAAAGQREIDLASCGEAFSGELLDLCMNAQSQEETWVNFKLFGMMGLTIVFVVAQGFYLARHIRDTEIPAETD